MKYIFAAFLSIFSILTFGQDKYSYVHYNKLIELKGTDFVIATIENWGKMMSTNSKYLLFIDTKNGQTKQINFSKDAYIQTVEQIKIDSLGINVVIVAANTVNLDGTKSIDWNDPKQIIILSTDGQEKTQITEDKYFVRTWTINNRTGTIVITGHYDSNNNGKYDKTDKNEIVIYDLRTRKLLTRI